MVGSSPGLTATTIELRDDSDGPARFDRIGARKRLGRYLLRDVIGKGGMGIVYRAFDPVLDRVVALKVIAIAGRDRDKIRIRAKLEARALASATHPNVVTIYDVGHADDLIYISMELVDGVDLRGWLETPRSTDEILDVFCEAGRGLHAAHARGIVHRDFKPSNVLLGSDGRVRVVDFGLARLLYDDSAEQGMPTDQSGESDSLNVTQAGVVLGTPKYMSPEQHTGIKLTAASDQYSFCLALYESLHRRPLFDAKRGRTLAKQKLRYEGTKVAGALGPIQKLLDRGLQRRARQRFPTMLALVKAIERTRPKPSRKRWVALSIGALAATTIAATLNLNAAAPSRCDDEQADAERIFGSDATEELRTGLGGLDHPLAASVADQAVAQTQRFAEAWTLEHDEVCEAWEQRPTSELGQQLDCLDEQRTKVGVRIEATVAESDPSSVVTVPAVFGRLPVPSQCKTVVWENDGGREHRKSLNVELERALVALEQRRFDAGVEGLASVAAAARSAGEPSVAARADLRRATALRRTGAYGESLQLAEASYFEALEAGDDELALWATASLVRYHGESSPNSAEIDRWRSRAEVLLERAGAVDTAAHAQLEEAEAAVAQAAGRLSEAEAHYRRAIEVTERASEGPLKLGIRRLNLASVLVPQRREEEAIEVLLRAQEEIERGAGPQAEALPMVSANLCAAFDNLGQHDQAISRCEASIRQMTQMYGDDSPKAGMVRLTLAQAYRNAERYDEALRTAREVRAQFIAARGPDHQDVAVAEGYLATIHQARGEHDDAIASLRSSVEIARGSVGEDNYVYGSAMAALGSAQRWGGHFEDAEASMREAIRVLPIEVAGPGEFALLHADLAAAVFMQDRYDETLKIADDMREHLPQAADDVRADFLFLRARSLHGLDPTSKEAVREATAAAQLYLQAGGRYTKLAADVREWLAETGHAP